MTTQIVKTGTQIKIEETILKLEAKREANKGLNLQDAKILANSKYKLDSRSASKLFKECEALPEATKKEILGTHAFPKAKDFFDALPKTKMLFSMWDGLGVLASMNKNGQRAARAAAQEQAQNGAPVSTIHTPIESVPTNTPKGKGGRKPKVETDATVAA